MATPSSRVRKPFKKANSLCKRVEKILIKASRERKLDIQVSEVVVGGSVAHGTAVPSHFDLDLVVFSPSLNGRESEQRYGAILDQLMDCLKSALTNQLCVSNPNRLFHGWRFKSWHFQVDLQLSPQWKTMEELFVHLKDIKPKSKRNLFGCGTVKFQNELLQTQLHRVKVLIKRIKAWRNAAWPTPKNGCPKSYFLSCLVLISYEAAPQHIKGSKRLRSLAKWMANDIKQRVKDIHRNSTYLDLHVPGENPIIMARFSGDLPEKPRIVDPANPFKNLYVQGLCEIEPKQNDNSAKRWEIFAEKVSSLNLVMNIT